MEMVFCPGCAGDVHDGSGACPVCGASQAVAAAPGIRRNPFMLIACCVLWSIGIWFGALFLVGVAAGDRLSEALGGPFLLASIGLSIGLTVRGMLPGTAKPVPQAG
ncbi:hypothetical protein [Massilia litorea]|jgi:hypothetical protein|uniref:Uncharacterized protein n=1 Tax=Massilia litorea TaxID=2769491 RepID=A0A7L9U636_9BURK|nr:hypothetical protein [Massilia litorea]QOL49889.1 hypothetical protein LPB04_00705 [Massilia litorea]